MSTLPRGLKSFFQYFKRSFSTNDQMDCQTQDETDHTTRTEENECEEDCVGADTSISVCKCFRVAENSSRFILRLLEAMRNLEESDDCLVTSTVEEIVKYFEINYRDVGDLYAQVQTGLRQVCSQGLAVELLKNEYHLIGPSGLFANQASNCQKLNCPVASSSFKTTTNTSSNEKCPSYRSEEDESPVSSLKCPSCEEILSEKNGNQCACSSKQEKRNSSNIKRQNQLQIYNNTRECLTGRNTSRRNGQYGSKKRKRNFEKDDSDSTSKRRSLSEECSDNSVSVINESIRMDDDVVDQNENECRENKSEMLDTRAKELARWIKRCQMECEKQKKR